MMMDDRRRSFGCCSAAGDSPTHHPAPKVTRSEVFARGRRWLGLDRFCWFRNQNLKTLIVCDSPALVVVGGKLQKMINRNQRLTNKRHSGPTADAAFFTDTPPLMTGVIAFPRMCDRLSPRLDSNQPIVLIGLLRYKGKADDDEHRIGVGPLPLVGDLLFVYCDPPPVERKSAGGSILLDTRVVVNKLSKQ
jgi:hypothetical protein